MNGRWKRNLLLIPGIGVAAVQNRMKTFSVERWHKERSHSKYPR